MISTDTDVLTETHRQDVVRWVLSSEHLDKFNNTTTQSDTRRDAFAATYDKTTLPEMFQFFECDKTNVYNLVCIVTYQSGDIPEHQDDDFTCHMLENNVLPLYASRPHTTSVYYAQIDPGMTGGHTVINQQQHEAIQNGMLSFPSHTPHSVTSMNSPGVARVVVVCEKYRLLRKCLSQFEFPIFRAG